MILTQLHTIIALEINVVVAENHADQWYTLHMK